MATKNLPIKFFQKRQKDESDTEPGGKKSVPKWINLDEVQGKYIHVRQVLHGLEQGLSDKLAANNYIPTVLRLRLEDAALAKTYRTEIGNLFNVEKKLNIFGVSGEDELLIKIENKNDLNKIISNMSKIQNQISSEGTIIGISAINNIEEFTPIVDVDLDNNEDVLLKIKLLNFGDNELNSILIRSFEKFCRERNIAFQQTAYSADLNIYSAIGVTQDSLEALKDFDGIQFVTEMPSYKLTLDELAVEDTTPIKYPKEGKEYPLVGVLDTGIANIPHLTPWLHSDSITHYPDEYIDKKHGTFVAGVILYGDELEGSSYTAFDGCKLFEAIVFPDLKKQMIYEYELIDQIRESVSRNNHIKIWNLSLGTDNEADLHEFSEFAQALDEIQDHNDVLICKSAGNCYNFIRNAPKGRIANSADTIRGIVVGSLAHAKNDSDLSDVLNPSPFSRKGPGPSHLIKPDVVHIGGNAGLDIRNNIVNNPVKSFSPTGSISHAVGTSFSTPRITAIAAGLDFMMKDEFSSILLKGLIIHSAKYPTEMKMNISEKLKHTGFGLPSNVTEILYNEPNEITLILQDTLEKGNFIDILDFPFPQSMIDEEGYYYGEVTVTLVTAPILEVSQGAEYCQSNIDVMFGSYDVKTSRDMSKRNVKNPVGAEGRKNILDSSLYSSKANKDLLSPFHTERMLVAYGDKFQPVKKWSINFDEFRDGNREKFLKGPKNWYLKLKGLYRHFTEQKCLAENRIPIQEFALIITIKDTKKRGNIYNEVTQLLDNFSFIHSNVKIRQEVEVRVNNNNQ